MAGESWQDSGGLGAIMQCVIIAFYVRHSPICPDTYDSELPLDPIRASRTTILEQFSLMSASIFSLRLCRGGAICSCLDHMTLLLEIYRQNRTY